MLASALLEIDDYDRVAGVVGLPCTDTLVVVVMVAVIGCVLVDWVGLDFDMEYDENPNDWTCPFVVKLK